MTANTTGAPTRRPAKHLVNAEPVRAHLKLLSANGIGLGRVAEITGIRAPHARAIRALYDELSLRNPAEFGIHPRLSSRAVNRARALGWPRPLEWDDDLIDDPNAEVQRVDRVERAGRAGCAVTDDEIEDALWIVRTTGADTTSEHERALVAERLGVTVHRLEYILAKASQQSMGVAA